MRPDLAKAIECLSRRPPPPGMRCLHGLADARIRERRFTHSTTEIDESKTAADAALAIDLFSAAHQWALSRLNYDWDWRRPSREYRPLSSLILAKAPP